MKIESEHTLKNGITITIRKGRIEDAELYTHYLKQVGGETDNLTFGNEGFELETVKGGITRFTASDNSTMIMALHDNKIVGCLTFDGDKRPRLKHSGNFGLTVLKEYWGLKIGTILLEIMIKWAKETKVIRKINLKVREDNTKAIQLYKKFNFKEEGLVTREYFINNRFYSNILMGLELD